jgi:hypothetical protein
VGFLMASQRLCDLSPFSQFLLTKKYRTVNALDMGKLKYLYSSVPQTNTFWIDPDPEYC